MGWAAALVVAAGCWLQDRSRLEPIRSRFQTTSFRLGVEDVTQLHSLLLERGLLDLERRLVSESTRALPAEAVRDGVPTLSIASEEEGLYSPERGIVTHAREKGRRWERPATISFFEGGKLRYETPAGLRIHGGHSRGGEFKSFQIVFRRSYAGRARAAPGIFFGAEGPPRQRLVLSNTAKTKRFLNPIAYEIAQSVGCIVSRAEPVRVYLNGERIACGYFMIEHQSREFLKHRYGHDDFEWVRLKGQSNPSGSFRRLRAWIDGPTRHKTMQSAAQHFDLDNLSAWIFAVTLCATVDVDQGGYFKDKKEPEAVWRCLTWDLDGSFARGEPEKTLEFKFDRVGGLRGDLFRKLMKNDGAFRQHYRDYAARMLREKVSPAQLSALFEKYRVLLASDIFVEERKDIAWRLKEAEKFLVDRHTRYLPALDRWMEKNKQEARR